MSFPLYYEQGTGAYGDGSQIVFARPLDNTDPALDDDDLMWQYINTSETVDFEDIVAVLRAAQEHVPPSVRVTVDNLLAVLDPEE